MGRVRAARPGGAARVVEMSAAGRAGGGRGPRGVRGDIIGGFGFGEPLMRVLVAEADDGLVGHVIATRSFDVQEGAVTYWLADLFVEEAYRRRGVGSRLVG